MASGKQQHLAPPIIDDARRPLVCFAFPTGLPATANRGSLNLPRRDTRAKGISAETSAKRRGVQGVRQGKAGGATFAGNLMRARLQTKASQGLRGLQPKGAQGVACAGNLMRARLQTKA